MTRVAAGRDPVALVAAASERLARAGVASPRHDAELLAAHVLGVSRARLPLTVAIDDRCRLSFMQLIDRRATREPLQHLTGVAPFRRLLLSVGPGVFVPRPETEGLVELLLTELRRTPAKGVGHPVIVDLCAGSGAVALAVADEIPGARVHAVEVDPGAIAWLRRNVAETALAVTVHEGDAERAQPVPDNCVDIVVSNPPYLPDGLDVEPEVGRYDPPLALWAGADGLTVLAAVVATGARLLRPGGLLAVEHADTQGPVVADLFRHAGFVEVTIHRDLTGRDRYATGHLP